MASAAQISVTEYLRSSYRPDREYVDGELRERNAGKWEHARVQWLLSGWFMNHESSWGVVGSTGERLEVSGTQLFVELREIFKHMGSSHGQ